MFCGVIASWKLECKCKRLLWTEYWYSKLFRLLWKVLNITDVFDYLRFNFKTQDFVMRLPIRQVRSHNKVRALFAENKVRFARAEQLWHIVVKT